MSIEESTSRQWTDWDRETRQVEMSLSTSSESVRISASLQDQGVACLEAKLNKDALEITELFVNPEINYKAKGGIFRKARILPGRGCGFGSILIRALVAFARRQGIKAISGEVMDQHMKENRYLLEWFSKRGFIIIKAPTDAKPGVAAAYRMTI